MTRDPRAAAMTEAQLQEQVRLMCAQLGLFHYHPRNSRGSEPGWPDSTIIGPRKVIFRELKTEHGSLSPEQRHVGDLIRAAGGNWAVWRPRDLLSGAIGRQLADLAGVQLELFEAAP